MTPVTTRFGVMAPVVGRITEKATFRALARSRRRGSAGPLTVSYCAPERPPGGSTPGRPGPPRVGYAVSKQVGNAVVRNRVRRRLRAATRSLASSLPSGAYLVRAAPGSVTVGFSDTCDLLGRAAMAAARHDDRGRGVRAHDDRVHGARA